VLSKIKQLITRDEVLEQASKEYERTVISLITSSDTQAVIPDDRLKLFNFSVLLPPADLKSVANALNDLRTSFHDVTKAKVALEHQVSQLTQDLHH
jgi:hypothetical protein